MSTPTAEQIQKGQAALDDLEKQRVGAYYKVVGTYGDASSRDAALFFLKTTAVNQIASLRTRLFGGYDFPRWVQEASDLQRSIASVAGDTSTWGLLAVLQSTAGATGQQLGTAAQNVVAGAGVGAGVVTFLVLGYLAWKVLK